MAACAGELKVPVLPDEGWWGGATTYGTKAPFGLNAKSLSFDLRKTNDGNQAAPLMLSTKGRFVWSEKAFACTFTNDVMTFVGDAPIEVEESGSDLRTAFLSAGRRIVCGEVWISPVALAMELFRRSDQDTMGRCMAE